MGEFPNKETQFSSEYQPEKNGRPKGSKSLKTVLREMLAAKDPQGEWANPLAIKLLKKAVDDEDLKAIVEVIDRIEGKITQTLEHKTEGVQKVLFERVVSENKTDKLEKKEEQLDG